MGAPTTADALAPLLRHRERRVQGLPTVTLLAGDRRVASWLWRSQSIEHRQAVVSAAVQRDELLEDWLGGPATLGEMHAVMLRMIADAEAIPTTELLCRFVSRSTWQLEQLAERHAPALGVDTAMVLRAFGIRAEPRSAALNAGWPQTVERLLGTLPSLLVVPGSDTTDTLRTAVRTLSEIAEAVPKAEIGLAVEVAALDSLQQSLSDRLSTMLAEGLVVLKPRQDPVPRAAAQRAPVLEYDRELFARSQAELQLFEKLRTRERTKGLFQLNQTVGPLDDGSPLEVDLLSEDLRIAVEVDGYHHFRDAIAYRRDRRKDMRLQDHGYYVVRVLASDVENELEHVIEIIDLAVERAQRRLQ
jgi:very-short-patch-repair endonuclease